MFKEGGLFNQFFKRTRSIKDIQKEWTKQQTTIESMIHKLSTEERYRMEWCTVQGRLCSSTGLLMWEKDLQYKYTFANARLCNDFYNISLADVRTLIGKTDEEVTIDFTNRTGQNHSFGGICKLTDEYTIKSGKTCRFWEMGYVAGKIIILDVTKSPIFTIGDKAMGIRSWALNQSVKECEIKSLLKLFLKTGEASPLSVLKNQKVAAYLINKKDDLFNGEFPGGLNE